jgi:hypothetical protein
MQISLYLDSRRPAVNSKIADTQSKLELTSRPFAPSRPSREICNVEISREGREGAKMREGRALRRASQFVRQPDVPGKLP